MSQELCPNCGKPLPNDTGTYCPECGEPRIKEGPPTRGQAFVEALADWWGIPRPPGGVI